MHDFQNTLHNMPSEEHLTARKASKLKFLQMEFEQLKTYMEDLEFSLNIYKQMLQDFLSVKSKEPFLSDGSENTISLMSSRLLESLLLEKRILEERLRKNIIDRNDAAHQASYNEKIAQQAKDKEVDVVNEFEETIKHLFVESEHKEKIIRDLQQRNRILSQVVENYNKSWEKQLPIEEQKKILKKKGETMVEMLMELDKEHDDMWKEIQELLVQCKDVVAEYSRSNGLLRDPQPDIRTDFIMDLFNRENSSTDLWVPDEKNLQKIIEDLGINPAIPNFTSETILKNSALDLSKPEKSQENLKRKCEKYQKKLQIISQEIENANKLKTLLKQDQKNLKENIKKNKAAKKELEETLKVKNPGELENLQKSKKFRSNSNPFDYAQLNFNEGIRKKQINIKTEDLNEVQDRDVSLILPSVVLEDILDDSLMDIFDAEEEEKN